VLVPRRITSLQRTKEDRHRYRGHADYQHQRNRKRDIACQGFGTWMNETAPIVQPLCRAPHIPPRVQFGACTLPRRMISITVGNSQLAFVIWMQKITGIPLP
jgi:hypothetical protein